MNSRSTSTKILSISASIAPIIFGCVFLVSGAAKIFSFSAFTSTIHQFRISEPYDTILAGVLIALELAVGVCIVMNRLRVEAIVTAMILLALFMAAITLSLGVVNGANCSCFGPLVENKLGAQVIVQDLILLLFGLLTLGLSTLKRQAL